MALFHNTTSPDIETAGPDYQKRFQGEVGAFFLAVQEALVREALEALSCTRPGKILEVGGGHGQLTGLLLRLGHEVWVHGSDETCFERLRAQVKEGRERLHFVASSLWSLPFEADSFDVAIGVRLLAHVERWEEMLTEMLRVSRYGTIVDAPLSSALNALSPFFFGFKRKVEGNTRPYFSYSVGQFDAYAAKVAASVCFRRREFFVPMGIHRLVGSAKFSRRSELICQKLGLTHKFGSPAILAFSRCRSDSQNHHS